MRCPTCGERYDESLDRCLVCDARAERVPARRPPVKRCPRCGYRGEGISYFRRPGHLALLVGVGLLTYGLGALAYWLARRNHTVCPDCGLRWESAGQLLPRERKDDEEDAGRGIPAVGEDELPANGMARRALGVVFFLVAVVLVVIGLGGGGVPLVAAGGGVAAGGCLTFWWGWRALEERREALLTALQRRVLHLARQRGGTLTVTDVAAELDLSLQAAERVLISMDDGFRVRSEISREGILYYEFPEVQHRKELGGGDVP